MLISFPSAAGQMQPSYGVVYQPVAIPQQGIIQQPMAAIPQQGIMQQPMTAIPQQVFAQPQMSQVVQQPTQTQTQHPSGTAIQQPVGATPIQAAGTTEPPVERKESLPPSYTA